MPMRDGRQSDGRPAPPTSAPSSDPAAPVQVSARPGAANCVVAGLARLAEWLASAGMTALLVLIRCYQAWVRPNLAGSCKFCPSCSEYAAEALQVHGVRRGARLAIRRLVRCHPFSAGGIDPVPAP